MQFSTDFSHEYEKKGLNEEIITQFQTIIWNYYTSHPRKFPWRDTRNPYHIFVSEIMLQQTQAERVVEKYNFFLSAFPDFKSLANSTTEDLLKLWHGLGYNRRALWMQENARIILEEYKGKLPSDPSILEKLKGIGHATAREMVIFSFNTPFAFIETNIRRVYIHFFFNAKNNVSDKDILPLVEKTMNLDQPRHWFYALMDYGVMLKKKFPQQNPNKKSKAYKPQSRFEGSNRQLRGKILQLVMQKPSLTIQEITEELGESIEKVKPNIEKMIKEGFFIENNGHIAFKLKTEKNNEK